MDNEYLEHWGLKKGAKKENHKYIARIELQNGKYRYFYTNAEYNAYLKAKEIRDKTSQAIDYATKKVKDVIDQKQREIDHKKMVKTVKKLEKNGIQGLNPTDTNAKRKDFQKEIQRQVNSKVQNFTEKANKFYAKDPQHRNALTSFKEDYSKHPEIKVKSKSMTKDEDMAAINKNRWQYSKYVKNLFDAFMKETDSKREQETYKQYLNAVENEEKWHNNCASCTIAYDLRRRGYDVTAPKQTTTGFTREEIADCYKDLTAYNNNKRVYKSSGSEKINGKNYAFSKSETDTIVDTILNENPEGAYGYLSVRWCTEGAHACIWSVEDGDVVIRDCQINETFEMHDYLSKAYNCQVVRIDDLELSDIGYAYANALELDGTKIIKSNIKKG